MGKDLLHWATDFLEDRASLLLQIAVPIGTFPQPFFSRCLQRRKGGSLDIAIRVVTNFGFHASHTLTGTRYPLFGARVDPGEDGYTVKGVLGVETN